jgi:nicotinamidase-related amidase
MSKALIVGDVQQGITHNFDFSEAVIEPISGLLTDARREGMEVIFVRAALRESRADLSPRNMVMTSFFEVGDLFHEMSAGTHIDSRVAPLGHETIVTKRRASAFHGTDLDIVLRSRGIDAITIVGVATSAMVLATVLDAIDLDYTVSVVRQGCADFDPEVHDFLMDRIFPARGAAVVDSASWLQP